MRFLLLTLFLVISLSPSSWADGPPVPPSKKGRAASLEKNLQSQKKQQASLESKVKNIEGELGKTRKLLVETGKTIQKSEKILQTLEARIEELEQQKSALHDELVKDRQSISRLIMALERIRRIPPEALIAKPGAPYKTAQSAMLMRNIVPSLNKQAEKLKHNINELDKVTQDLKIQKETALKTFTSLKAQHTQISSLIGKREKLYKNTRNDLKAQAKHVLEIAHQAKNLQDLVKKLEEDKKRRAIPTPVRKASIKHPQIKLPDTGQAQLPISGIVRVRYNQPDNFGAPSKGFTIEGRSGALVVAPMGGVVRFAGHFKNYGNLIILEHKKGYHSLIAGLEKIDTVVGHSVSAGEPLGILRHSVAGDKPALYYELRLNGQPIDPAGKFIDLG